MQACLVMCDDLMVFLHAAPDPPGSTERSVAPQKRKVSSPTHSSNGHSPSDTSPSPLKKKKKPGAVNCNNKDQVRAPVYSFQNLVCSQRLWGVVSGVNASVVPATGGLSLPQPKVELAKEIRWL